MKNLFLFVIIVSDLFVLREFFVPHNIYICAWHMGLALYSCGLWFYSSKEQSEWGYTYVACWASAVMAELFLFVWYLKPDVVATPLVWMSLLCYVYMSSALFAFIRSESRPIDS